MHVQCICHSNSKSLFIALTCIHGNLFWHVYKYFSFTVAAATVSKEKHIICRTPLIAQYVYLKKHVSCSDESKWTPTLDNTSTNPFLDPLFLIEKAGTNQEKVSSLTKSASSTDSREVMKIETAAASKSTCQDQCLNKILLTNLPCSIDTDHLKLQLEKATKLHCSEEFLLDRRDDTSATITFKRSLLLEGTR